MKTKLTIVLSFISLISLSAQDLTFKNVKIDPVLIDTGSYKNYFKYDMGDYILYNGRYENNLNFKIQDKVTHNIEYVYKDTISDAMILKPKFFENADNTIKVIMIEVAAEYSWGQEIILIKDKTVKYLGYLDYIVDLEEGLSISDYCRLYMDKEKIIMIFDDVPIIYWPEESKKINGKDLKFELDVNGINRVK